jgi:hypothetical protein
MTLKARVTNHHCLHPTTNIAFAKREDGLSPDERMPKGYTEAGLIPIV